MKKATAKLSVVKKPIEEERDTKSKEESRRWEEAEKRWRITPHEAGQRIRVLRRELESYQAQIEGVPFGIASGSMFTPLSLDGADRKYTLELVEDFNPLVNGFMEMIDAYAKEHGTHEGFDFQSKLFDLKMQAAETGFEIGVLAGVIFSGASKETVDRFERGMIFNAIQSNRLVVKE